MISRWFIGVNAKSKGFFKGFQPRSYYFRSNKEDVSIKPSFTKQSALATSYGTKEEAESAIDNYRQIAKKDIDECNRVLNKINYIQPKWDTIDNDDKISFLIKNNILIYYQTTNRYGNSYTQNLHFHAYNRTRKYSDLTEYEKEILLNPNWSEVKRKNISNRTYFENQLKFIDENLVVREQDIELKFMNSERRKIKWEHREKNDTSGNYCNCCGGAIPDVPQLIIGTHWKDRCVICAICMSKLAEEAKIQAGKVSDEVLEHYQTERFLRAMD